MEQGFSNTTVEAMAFGKLVITPRVVGYPIVDHGNEGLIVEPTDYKSIASCAGITLRDRGLYEKLSKNAVERSRKYTWRELANMLLEIYETVLT